jgi:hypothetical protein
VGGESSGMLQKADSADMVIGINKVLGGSAASLSGSEENVSSASQAFDSPFSGAGKCFQPFHQCCNSL